MGGFAEIRTAALGLLSHPVSDGGDMRFPRRVGRVRYTTLALLLAALPVACVHKVERPPDQAMVAQLALDHFMQAVNQRDLIAMGHSFGTENGPVDDTGSTFSCFFKKIGSWFGGTACSNQADVQVRMAAIANILKHEDYHVVREQPVAGRLNTAREFFVDVTVHDNSVVKDVPFIMVRADDGRWLVERVDLPKVMGGG